MSQPKPLIVVADGFTTNPGDLDWAPLEACGEVTIYDRCGPSLLERCRQAAVVLTNKEVLNRAALDQLPELKFISVLATGTNVVDIAAATDRGIPVSNVPGYADASVAQHVVALMLGLQSRPEQHAAAVHSGRWASNADFSFTLGPIEDLAGKTFGIVGYGRIGKRVAALARAFGMRVLAASSQRRDQTAGSNRESSVKVQTEQDADNCPEEQVERVPLDELFQRSDVLSLHCPLTPQTQHLVNAQRLSLMKPSALLINTGRGPLIDEPALASALQGRQLAGVGLDVLSSEPPSADNPLLKWAAQSADNATRCLITPHLAWASVQSRARLLEITVANVQSFLEGRPQNLVNPEVMPASD